MLIEDLTARRIELNDEFTEMSSKSEGSLRAEIGKTVTKRFKSHFLITAVAASTGPELFAGARER